MMPDQLIQTCPTCNQPEPVSHDCEYCGKTCCTECLWRTEEGRDICIECIEIAPACVNLIGGAV